MFEISDSLIVDRLKHTVFEVTQDGNNYVTCGETGSSLQPNNSVIIVSCQTPLLATRLRLRRYGQPESHNMNICEVFATGYLFQGRSGYSNPSVHFVLTSIV